MGCLKVNISRATEPLRAKVGMARGISAVNEGFDKEVLIVGVCGDVGTRFTVIHEGLRQPFGLSGGGVFRTANGGRFGVLK